ncbi:hypothetical protein BHE74_00038932 [Ensete ventricosum]|nr:hypothetical protein BHE74_00038932 [Ensete ventricosum]
MVVSVQGWSSGRREKCPRSGLRARLLEWWSSGRVKMFRFGSATGSYRKVRSGRVGSRRDPSDGQVSLVVDFAIPLLCRGARAFIATVTGYLYLNLLPSSLLTKLLHLTTLSVVRATRRAPAIWGCRPCPPYLTSPGDLAEKVNSGTNPGDLAERVNSGTSPEDLAKRVNSDTNPGDLAETMNSGTSPGDLVEKVNLGTNPGDLAEKVNSGTNPRDLAERVNSGINPRDLAKRGHLFPGVRGVSQGDPEASSSGASLGPPSLVDVRVLRDLEVMKADHDLNTVVTEGSLAVIRGRYSIPVEYGLHIPWPGQRPYSLDALGMCISVDALEAGLRFSLHPLIEEYRMDLGDLRGMPKMSGSKAPSTRVAAPAREVSVSPAREAPKVLSKRSIDALTEQVDDLARRHKKVKALTRRHKSRHGEGESCSHSKGKEPTTPSEEPETPAESDEGAHRRFITARGP